MNAAAGTIGDLIRLPRGATIANNPLLNRLARHPAMRAALLVAQADAELQERMTHPGYSVLNQLLSHPAAEHIIAHESLLWGRVEGTPFDEAWRRSATTPGKYGITLQNDEMLPALSDVLSTATGQPVDASAVTPEEALAILDSYAARQAESENTEDNVRVTAETGGSGEPPDPCDELCEIACACLTDRGGARTFTECVAQELRRRYYNGGRHPTGPNADGPRPEVSYRPGPNGYEPVMSQNRPGLPSSAPVVRGAPRPDVSWWRGGRLWKIFELKFPGDTETAAQRRGVYENIAEDQGLRRSDVQRLNVGEDCDCSTGRAKPGVC